MASNGMHSRCTRFQQLHNLTEHMQGNPLYLYILTALRGICFFPSQQACPNAAPTTQAPPAAYPITVSTPNVQHATEVRLCTATGQAFRFRVRVHTAYTDPEIFSWPRHFILFARVHAHDSFCPRWPAPPSRSAHMPSLLPNRA